MTDKPKPEAERLADWLDSEACGGSNWNAKMHKAAAELRRLSAVEAERDALREEVANLKTVMIAAAEEISEHWQAHCDAEGYGPANLMRRLEDGIPAQYGYTAGRFRELQAQVARLEADARRWDYWRNYWPALCRMEVARFARLDLRTTYVQGPADMDKVTDAAIDAAMGKEQAS